MKAFERIQREGPPRRFREATPLKQTLWRRRRFSKSESVDSKVSEDCVRNENVEKGLLLQPSMCQGKADEAKTDEERVWNAEENAECNADIETLTDKHLEDQLLRFPIKCEMEDENKEDGKISAKDIGRTLSGHMAKCMETEVKVERCENSAFKLNDKTVERLFEEEECRTTHLCFDSTFTEKSKASEEDSVQEERKAHWEAADNSDDSPGTPGATPGATPGTAQPIETSATGDEGLRLEGKKETATEAETRGGEDKAALKPRRSERVRRSQKVPSGDTQDSECCSKETPNTEYDAGISANAGNSGESVENSVEMKALCILAAQPKIQPLKTTDKNQEVMDHPGKEAGGKELVNGKSENRVRTRSRTKEESAGSRDSAGNELKLTTDHVRLFLCCGISVLV